MPNEERSLQAFRIQVERGLPGGLLQLSGGCANRIRVWGGKILGTSIKSTGDYFEIDVGKGQALFPKYPLLPC